ncbi:spore germination protein [Paenibacillus selenitireducens]|uniref:Spore germination protein n=1 Tax=Paenibacillus selenitireducens TaxID=1324314 RepID=A0A1T2X0C1_9BACL|nr:spore germination protein [Paenibacillus selenitireducens]OPA73317.1 spore germination protein [Paenibacillus selenitireducens]
MDKNPIPTSNSSNELGGQPTLTINQLLTCLVDCGDVRSETHLFGPSENSYKVVLIYCDGLADMKQLNQYVIPLLASLLEKANTLNSLDRNNPLTLQPILPTAAIQAVEMILFSGQLIIGIEQDNLLYAVNIANPPNRTPEESNTEISIKGPKDGFTEDLSTNIALIRKRMRTRSLKCEIYTIGVRSQTKVSLMYVSDIMNSDILNDVRQRLQKIDTDAVVSSSQLGEALGDSKYALFPMLDYIGRPDYVVQSLVRGRFIIIAEGSPMVLIGPANLLLTLKSPEDIHFPYFFVAFQRILRFIGLFISIFMPGIWISLIAFNLEQLPFSLLATVTISRLGLPFSAPMEMILMLGLFEIFREAGIRLPKAVGQTVAVVGGIIIGDAAIRAGLSSATTLVVAAVTAVATFTLVNQSLSGTVSILRLFVLIVSSVLGMYGFIISLITIVFYLSIQQAFGIPYLAPISPPIFRDMIVALFTLPVKILKRRPAMLHTTDDTRQGEDST